MVYEPSAAVVVESSFRSTSPPRPLSADRSMKSVTLPLSVRQPGFCVTHEIVHPLIRAPESPKFRGQYTAPVSCARCRRCVPPSGP